MVLLITLIFFFWTAIIILHLRFDKNLRILKTYYA